MREEEGNDAGEEMENCRSKSLKGEKDYEVQVRGGIYRRRGSLPPEQGG